MKWILLSERRPEPGQIVLLYEMTKCQGNLTTWNEYHVIITKWGSDHPGMGWPELTGATHWTPVEFPVEREYGCSFTPCPGWRMVEV